MTWVSTPMVCCPKALPRTMLAFFSSHAGEGKKVVPFQWPCSCASTLTVAYCYYIHAMYHAHEGYLIATNELMSLHVALETRRGAPMAPEVLARLSAIQAAHDALSRPPQVGRVMGLAVPPTTRR